jgi:hypothetical protein
VISQERHKENEARTREAAEGRFLRLLPVLDQLVDEPLGGGTQ